MKRMSHMLSLLLLLSACIQLPRTAAAVTGSRAAAAPPVANANPRATDSTNASVVARQKEISRQRMRRIYNAIQAYRKDHKELPDFLSDLYPKYIADTNVFLCPALPPDEQLPFPESRDPKLLVQYSYEFNANPIQAMFGYSGPMTMGAWKRMQMSVVGGGVPILRCFAFKQVLNISFDGQFYESPLVWEQKFADKIKPGELEPRSLRLLFLTGLGAGTNGAALAYQQLQDAVTANDKGVYTSGSLSDQQKKWNEEVARTSLADADLAGRFATNFPRSAHAVAALVTEAQMLAKADTAGLPDAGGRLDALVTGTLKRPGLTGDERFELRSLQLTAGLAGESDAEQTAAYEHAARQLIREFPKRSEPYFMLLSLTQQVNPAKRRALVEGVRHIPDVPKAVKQQANSMLRRMNLVGHPLDMQFTALDGRKVDLAELKGKVVLVDFWATWCGPCVYEIPWVKEIYQKFHDRGLEIVGISFDTEKSALEKFVKSKNLPWPQYFDGQGWKNKYGVEYGIEGIPTMWLVNRSGNVADTDVQRLARKGITEEIERLLAGKETAAR